MGKIKNVELLPFNSELELGIRMVYLLSSLYPMGADLQKLVLLDYAIIYSSDFNGPENLHTPVPLRAGELFSRRELIQSALYLMSKKGLVTAELDETGFLYFAGENARTLVDSLGSSYALALADRCKWVVQYLGYFDSFSLSEKFNKLGFRWRAEMDSQSISCEVI